MATKFDNIILGSGQLYLGLCDNIADLANLTPEEEAALINVGAIESGATLEIETDAEEVESANMGVIARFPIKTTVTFKTGVMTWNLDNLKFLLDAQVTTDTLTGEKKTVIGPAQKFPEVYLRFKHQKRDGGELIINIYRAQPEGNLALEFAKEDPTVVDYSFIALPKRGSNFFDCNYLEIIETFPQA